MVDVADIINSSQVGMSLNFLQCVCVCGGGSTFKGKIK